MSLINHRVRECSVTSDATARISTTIGGGGALLKVRPLPAEVEETLLYGCGRWNLKPFHYGKLWTAHHLFLVRCMAWKKR